MPCRRVLVVLMAVMLAGCGKPDPDAGWQPPAELLEGDICAIRADEKHYRIVKIIAVDDQVVVHLRVYKGDHDTRPSDVDVSTLRVGDLAESLDRPRTQGVPHLHVLREEFMAWRPTVLTNAPVTLDELAPVLYWRENRHRDQADVND
jgi:hypothetical protein